MARRVRGRRAWVGALARALAASWWAVGCVETAECDATTVCSGGEVCFRFACRPRCDGPEARACGEGSVCAACARYEACHGEAASACVDPSVIEEAAP